MAGVPERLGMPPAEAARRLAFDIWCGDQTHVGFHVGGLNQERAVRDRLEWLRDAVDPAHVTPDAFSALSAVRIDTADPLAILEASEEAVAACFPSRVRGSAALLDAAPPALAVVRILVVQSLAGRLGRWAVRDHEVADARTARSLARQLGPIRPRTSEAELLAEAKALFGSSRFDEAAIRFLEVDRLRRSPDALFKAALALWKGEHYEHALWAIRACLLEDIHSFDTPDALLKAQIVESSLEAISSGLFDSGGDGEGPPQSARFDTGELDDYPPPAFIDEPS